MHLGVSARTTGPPNKGRISYGCWARSGQGLMFNDGKEPLETFKYLQKDPELWEALIKKERSEAKEQRRNRPASPEPLALDDDDSRMRVTLSQDVLEDPQFVGRRTPSSPAPTPTARSAWMRRRPPRASPPPWPTSVAGARACATEAARRAAQRRQ